MLFKRFFEGKSMLNTDAKLKVPEKCSRRRSECDGCVEHATILEEMMKMVLLGVVLWAGVTFGSQIAPYPLNLLVTPDNLHTPPMYNYPFPSPQNLKRIPPVTTARVNKSIKFSQMNVEMERTLENSLKSAEIKPLTGSAAQGLLIEGYPSSEAMHYQKSSDVITGASQNLVYTTCSRFGIPEDECASFISTLNLRGSDYGQECAALERFSCPNNKLTSKYRSFDGSCNNPVRSSWGQALTGYKRLLHPKYTDGIDEPRRAHNLQRALPSARLISMQLANNLDKPNEEKTMALPVWSQFIYHDLVHTPVRKMVHINQAIRCCDSQGFLELPRHQHPSCLPIRIPGRNWKTGDTAECMDYVRSVTTYRGDCTFGAVEQMNQATHFLDGSQIYGSNSRDAAALREKIGGLLKTSTIDGKEMLPLVADSKDRCLAGEICFNAGDIRVNQNPRLASLHVIWVREHNRIARSLAQLNPEWTSDKLYHEARRIVVAELQHITYKHWVPALTGKVFDELYEAYDTGYNSDVNPTVTNSFATAAFRFFNSLLHKDIQMVDEKTVESERKRIKDSYYNSDLWGEKNVLEKMVKGLINQKSQEMDLNFDDDLRHHWLGGLDVFAIDIQRGRDHGLPGYVQYRNMCGKPVTTFAHLTDIPSEVVDQLSKIYSDIKDIDLIVGMMAETPLPNSQLGPTATCLIKEQLWRTRSGDRYFYTHSDEAGSFTKRQLAEIKKVTLARIFCDNAGVQTIQKDVFRTLNENNPVVSCDEIKKLNLEAWQATEQKPDLLTRTNKWLKTKVGGPDNQTK